MSLVGHEGMVLMVLTVPWPAQAGLREVWDSTKARAWPVRYMSAGMASVLRGLKPDRVASISSWPQEDPSVACHHF